MGSFAARQNCQIIAEIGCNHLGDVSIAQQFIHELANLPHKPDVIKFQKRNPIETIGEELYKTPHPKPENAYGDTYGKHREFLELDINEHQALKNQCEQHGIKYACSVWDLTSAKQIAQLNPEYIKIPSACNLNKSILEWLGQNYKGEIHISLGMLDHSEIAALVHFFTLQKVNHRITLYSCTTGYPIKTSEVCLKEISYLNAVYGKHVQAIAFSGHHDGISLDIAALALGAQVIERHVTLNKSWKGTDHKMSLLPHELDMLITNIRDTEAALQFKNNALIEKEKKSGKYLALFQDKILSE